MLPGWAPTTSSSRSSCEPRDDGSEKSSHAFTIWPRDLVRFLPLLRVPKFTGSIHPSSFLQLEHRFRPEQQVRYLSNGRNGLPSPSLPSLISNRSSGPTDSLAPPQSPYPQTIEPSPTDSNGTESTDIDEDAQEDPRPNSSTPTGTAGGDSSGDALEVQSPDIEITSPSSAISVRQQWNMTQSRIETDGNRNTRPNSIPSSPPSTALPMMGHSRLSTFPPVSRISTTCLRIKIRPLSRPTPLSLLRALQKHRS